MGDAGEMDDGVDAGEQLRPVDGSAEVAVLHDRDAGRKRRPGGADVRRIGRRANRGVHLVPSRGERHHHRAADKAGRAGNEDFHPARTFIAAPAPA
jgi:hypothetical protein